MKKIFILLVIVLLPHSSFALCSYNTKSSNANVKKNNQNYYGDRVTCVELDRDTLVNGWQKKTSIGIERATGKLVEVNARLVNNEVVSKASEKSKLNTNPNLKWRNDKMLDIDENSIRKSTTLDVKRYVKGRTGAKYTSFGTQESRYDNWHKEVKSVKNR